MQLATPELYLRSCATKAWMIREKAPVYGPGTEGVRQDEEVDEQAVTSLGEEIMTLSELLQTETHRLLLLIAKFDRLQGWKLHGFSSCADWLAYSTGMKKVTARDHVRVARALTGLPETSAAMARGDLSFSQVRAITRVADEENERELLAHARETSADGLERLARSWRRLGREDEAALEARRHAERCLSVFPDDEGGYVVRGKLDPEVGALLMRAIEAASDALYRGSVPETTPEQRRADALALIAERAMAIGFGAPAGRRAAVRADDPIDAGESIDAVGVLDWESEVDGYGGASAEATRIGCAEDGAFDEPASAEARDARASCRAERYLVVLQLDTATLDPEAEPGRSELEDGTRVSAESSRRLACDANIVRVVHGPDSAGVRVEGKTRTVPLRIRRALEVRDRGCRFPGCGSRFTDAHHIRHWADGGATRLDNLILLCKTHHRLLHEGGFKLKVDSERPGRPAFYSPRGIRIPEVPPRMTIGGRAIGDRGVLTGSRPPRWEEDVPLAVYLRALESLS